MEKMEPMFHLHQGKRYRLRMKNASDDVHPVHLHRHSFELTHIAGKATTGIMKDVVYVGWIPGSGSRLCGRQSPSNPVSLSSTTAYGLRIYGAVRLRLVQGFSTLAAASSGTS
jgi:multicopper oxidase